MKKSILSIMLLSVTLFVTSCGTDSGENGATDTTPVGVAVNDGKSNGASTSGTDADSVSVSITLSSVDGNECTEFKTGQNIVFKLNIHNNTDRIVRLSNKENIFDESLFTIYTAEGRKVGNPWKTWRMNEMQERYTTVQPGSNLHWLCSWLYDERLKNEYTEPFGNPYDQEALPAGKYYTLFNIHLNGKDVITCRKEFSVQ